MNSKKSFMLGTIVGLLVFSGVAYAYTTYFMKIYLSVEKKPSTFIPKENSLIVTSTGGWSAGSFIVSNPEVGAEVMLNPFQDNETISTREFGITNMNHKYNYSVMYSLYEIPDGTKISVVSKMNDPWNVEGRSTWVQGNEIKIVEGQTLYFWVSVTDVEMNEGIYKFVMDLYAVQESS